MSNESIFICCLLKSITTIRFMAVWSLKLDNAFKVGDSPPKCFAKSTVARGHIEPRLFFNKLILTRYHHGVCLSN